MIIGLINSIPGINIPVMGRADFGGIKAMANGGIVNEPSIVYGLNSMRPIATMAENGPERVGNGGGVTNIFHIAGSVISENELVDIVSSRLSNELKLSGANGYV